MIQSPLGVLTLLSAIAAFFFFLEERTGWKVFRYLPPLPWIYATPVVLNYVGVVAKESEAYGVLRQYALPSLLILLLVSVDVASAVRIMGRAVLVMLLGSVGVVVGGVVAYLAVHRWLAEDAWRGFGALAGSWIGGTGNMAAAREALETPPEQFGLAVLADNVVYLVWLPLLLSSKSLADWFHRWARVSDERIERMEVAAAEAAREEKRPLVMTDLLYLGTVALACTWLADWVSSQLPEFLPVLSTSTWKVLLITTFGILLSLTPIRRLPGSNRLAMALVYVYVAGMGAQADLAGLGDAPVFLLGAFVWIAIHGLFCLGGAWALRIDIHSLAIASAANIGGAASAPVVAAYHRKSLVPASILLALMGYALGNYLAVLTGQLCYFLTS